MEIFTNLTELLEHPVFSFFKNISDIPRGSHNEREVVNYIEQWAEHLHLKTKRDSFNNLLIIKPASQGYEEHKPVILQAHTDMVLEKAEGIKHDFLTDPIHLHLDGDTLSTNGKTTLGADNGIGVATIMAILCDDLPAPEIHALFTTAEEDDLSGASNIDPSWLTTNRLINTDNFDEQIIVAGSAGGSGIKLSYPLEKDNNKYDCATIITVDGLLGGHSGQDIHKGRANAIVILADILNSLPTKFRISDIQGGNYRIAIPREATATIQFDRNYSEEIEDRIINITDEIKRRYEITDPNINISTTEAKPSSTSYTNTSQIVKLLSLLPNGVNDLFGNHPVVESSCNVGELYIKESNLIIVTEIRATYEYGYHDIENKYTILSKLFSAQIHRFASYPSWIYQEHSLLRDTVKEQYFRLYGQSLSTKITHGGLELGFFAKKIPNLDAISIGANTKGLHSPVEQVSVSSVIRSYELIKNVLKEL